MCSLIKQFSHGLGDAHVALGRLRGDTASGNQRLHWLVEEHAAGNKICYWKNSICTVGKIQPQSMTLKSMRFPPSHFPPKKYQGAVFDFRRFED